MSSAMTWEMKGMQLSNYLLGREGHVHFDGASWEQGRLRRRGSSGGPGRVEAGARR